MIKQLKTNVKSILSGMEDPVLLNQLPQTTSHSTTVPIGCKPEMMKSILQDHINKQN